MCFMTCEDMMGEMDCVVFPQLFAAAKSKLQPDNVVYVTGKLSHKDETVSLLCDSILSMKEIERKRLCCKAASTDNATIQKVIALCSDYPGSTGVCFYLTDLKKTIVPKSRAGVSLTEEFISKLEESVGKENIGLI